MGFSGEFLWGCPNFEILIYVISFSSAITSLRKNIFLMFFFNGNNAGAVFIFQSCFPVDFPVDSSLERPPVTVS